MKQFMIKLLVVCIGIGVGMYISSKINLLNDVVNDYASKNGTYVETSDGIDSENYINDLVLVNYYYDGFEIDLRYATKNNITKKVLYEEDLMYLQKSTLDKLIQVNEELRAKGFKLKIWDAYRPLNVQKKLWAAYPNANFIANPFTTGSNHNRGTAVDVTLVDMRNNEVDMPTGFDGFGAKSRRGGNWSSKERENVGLLTDTMVKHGFTFIDSEWWHFDDEDAKKYPIMDYKFRDLIKK